MKSKKMMGWLHRVGRAMLRPWIRTRYELGKRRNEDYRQGGLGGGRRENVSKTDSLAH